MAGGEKVIPEIYQFFEVIVWYEMASLSLPRVLQQRKTSVEQERENFEKCQVG